MVSSMSGKRTFRRFMAAAPPNGGLVYIGFELSLVSTHPSLRIASSLMRCNRLRAVSLLMRLLSCITICGAYRIIGAGLVCCHEFFGLYKFFDQSESIKKFLPVFS